MIQNSLAVSLTRTVYILMHPIESDFRSLRNTTEPTIVTYWYKRTCTYGHRPSIAALNECASEMDCRMTTSRSGASGLGNISSVPLGGAAFPRGGQVLWYLCRGRAAKMRIPIHFPYAPYTFPVLPLYRLRKHRTASSHLCRMGRLYEA